MALRRAVLDTTVMVSAIRSPYGAASAIVDLVLRRRVALLIDYRVSCEYRDVLLRREHIAASHLSADEISALLDRLEAVAEVVEINFRHRPLSTDPDDDRIIDLAINGRADTIVTRNLRHIVRPAAAWGIRTMLPNEFLITLKA